MFQRLFVLGCSFLLAMGDGLAQKDRKAERKRLAKVLATDPNAALRLASMSGKYKMLLRQFRVVERGKNGKDLVLDQGYKARKTYKGHRNLPAGYWVYARPYWFIWRDLAAQKLPKRRWGPEHLTGRPDSPAGVDRETAWATKLENNPATEWIVAEFDGLVKGTAVEIHETFNPGAVSRVSIFKSDGEELTVWKAKEVKRTGTPGRVLCVQLPLGFHIRRVKVYLQTSKVPGWNEVDAIRLIDDKKRTHWASAAEASTTYAQPRVRAIPAGGVALPKPVFFPGPVVPKPVVAKDKTKSLEKRLERVHAENQELRTRLQALEKIVRELQRRQKKR